MALLIRNYRSRLDDSEYFGIDIGSGLDGNESASDRSDEGKALDESIESDAEVGSNIEIKEDEEVNSQADSTTTIVRRVGLLLELHRPASGSEEALYQRIGIFWIDPKDNHGDANVLSWFDDANYSEFTII